MCEFLKCELVHQLYIPVHIQYRKICRSKLKNFVVTFGYIDKPCVYTSLQQAYASTMYSIYIFLMTLSVTKLLHAED